MNTTVERNTDTSVIPGRQLPFVVAGTDVTGKTTALEVMEAANLTNWNVHLRPIQTVPVTESVLTLDGVGTRTVEAALPVEDKFASVRTSPFTGKLQAIGVVGKIYTPTQNEKLAGILDAFAQHSGGEFVAAGDYYGKGKTVFFTIALPRSVMIGGVDRVDHYLSAFTSHDGTSSIAFAVHNMRVMCANARTSVLRSGDVSSIIRHTTNSDAKLALVRRDLDIFWKDAEKFDAQAEQLLKIKTTDQQFEEIVSRIFDTPGKVLAKRGETIKTNRNLALKQILHGPTNANIDGTAWAAYNCITEFMQHGHEKALTNAQRTLASRENRQRADQAMELLLSLS